LTNVDDAQPQARLLADGTTRHEANLLRVRGLAWFAAALAGVTALVLLMLTFVMRGFLHEEKELTLLAPPRFAGDTGEYPTPRIQADPADELKKTKTEDLGRLNTYGWVDRKAGVAHIPVDRAIEILARKGLPTALERGVTPEKPAEKESAPDRKVPAKAGAPGETKQ
jgi:hypothetical protein